jgi:hypothetical protein
MDKALDQWEKDLLADGWTAVPIYADVYTPGLSAQFKRDGYAVQIYRRADALSEFISGWGPDSVRIDLPEVYDFPALQAQLAICQECGAEGRTEPVVLRTAKRICPACRTALASELLSQY